MDYKNDITYEESWQRMMRQSLLASVSEKNPFTLSSGPLGQSNPSGVTGLAKHILDKQSSSILAVADEIWIAILKIQELMEIRNSINENCMQSEEEANRLLKATNSVQSLIEHISEQEDIYIKLSESINRNTIHVVQSYLKLMHQSIDLIKELAQKTSDELNLDLKIQNEGVEKTISNATSIREIADFSNENTLEKHTKVDPVLMAMQSLNHKKYDDFILIQAFVLVCYRFAMSQAVTHRSGSFDASKALQHLIQNKEKATKILHENDLEETFGLEKFSEQTSTSEQLQLALNVNPDFLKKVEDTLRSLQKLSDSRTPDDDDDDSDMKKSAA